ncbi:MAG: fused MFS/spermidine synthase [Planctomycetales bacterium]
MHSEFSNFGFKLLVFTSGAVLMSLEISGSLVLAPHFGNSVYVWGSLISVFLIALSSGYYFGGQVADKYPSRLLLNLICLLVSLWILVTPLLADTVCEMLVITGWGSRSGPLFASTLLFLPPSMGLGMVSPLAIRLATTSIDSVGKMSGSLHALSTVGSIVGTLLTTFVMMPIIGVSAMLAGLGLAFFFTAAFTLPDLKKRARIAVAASFPIVGLAWFILAEPLAYGENIADGDRSSASKAVIKQDRDSHFGNADEKVSKPAASQSNLNRENAKQLKKTTQSVQQFIQGYFNAWSNQDFRGYAACFAPEARIQIIEPSGQVTSLSKSKFLVSQRKFFSATDRMAAVEEPLSVDVRIEDRLARVFVRWRLKNGSSTSYGNDHFTLIKTGDIWQILHLLYYQTATE